MKAERSTTDQLQLRPSDVPCVHIRKSRQPGYLLAMLVNHRSGSDSEVTPMAFRQLGLGRIVGNPTAAAVIATGSYALINGGAIRTPGSLVVTYDPTKPNNYGVNLENLGVPPDVWVENSPMDEVKKIDRELRTAIEEAMKMLRATAPRVSSEQP